MVQFCWKIRPTLHYKFQAKCTCSLFTLSFVKKTETKKTILSWFKTHVFWACLEVSRNLRRKNCRKGEDFYKIHVQHVHCTLNWEILMTPKDQGLLFKTVQALCCTLCLCILPTGRSFLIVLDLRWASWLLHKGCHSLLGPAFPLEVSQVVSFLFFSPQ